MQYSQNFLIKFGHFLKFYDLKLKNQKKIFYKDIFLDSIKLNRIFSWDFVLLLIRPLANYNSFWYKFYLLYLNSTSLRSLLFKASHSVVIRILILLKILHKLTSEILVISAIFITSISDKKYHKISQISSLKFGNELYTYFPLIKS